MYCRRCYADLSQTSESRCPRCGRAFSADKPRSYLRRPFPPPLRIAGHTVLTLILATVVSFVIAGVLSLSQIQQISSGH